MTFIWCYFSSYLFFLLLQGIFYVDDTPAEEIAEQRKALRASKARDNSIELNLKLWGLMKSGAPDGNAVSLLLYSTLLLPLFAFYFYALLSYCCPF